MQKTRIYVAASLAAVAAGTAIAATKLSDKFSTSVLNSMWTSYADGGTTLSPSGGALSASTDGSGAAAVVIEGYQLSSDSWKASVSARQLKASSALMQASFDAFMGLQYGPLDEETDLNSQSNGYLIGVSIGDGYASAGWTLFQDGEEADGDGVELSTTKLLKGNVTALYNSSKDRLSIVVGKYKETFTFFMEDSPFFEDAYPYLGANADGGVSGTLFTFDNFSVTGKGLISAE
jgi:hypothetical protein